MLKWLTFVYFGIHYLDITKYSGNASYSQFYKL